jgi:hypothetical protein
MWSLSKEHSFDSNNRRPPRQWSGAPSLISQSLVPGGVAWGTESDGDSTPGQPIVSSTSRFQGSRAAGAKQAKYRLRPAG